MPVVVRAICALGARHPSIIRSWTSLEGPGGPCRRRSVYHQRVYHGPSTGVLYHSHGGLLGPHTHPGSPGGPQRGSFRSDSGYPVVFTVERRAPWG